MYPQFLWYCSMIGEDFYVLDFLTYKTVVALFNDQQRVFPLCQSLSVYMLILRITEQFQAFISSTVLMLTHLDALLPSFLGSLSDHQLTIIKLGQTAHLPPIHWHIVELLIQLELGLHGLEGGGGLDGPGAGVLGDGDCWCWNCGSLPQRPAEVENLEDEEHDLHGLIVIMNLE